MSEFTKLLKSARMKNLISMREMARRIGVSVVHYSDVENGRKNPFVDKDIVYEELARITGVSKDELLQIAAKSRDSIKIPLHADDAANDAVYSFARMAENDELGPTEYEDLRKLLKKWESARRR